MLPEPDNGRLPLADAASDPRSLRRDEDFRFLTGAGRFADDVKPLPGELVALFLRSPHAHADLVSIDTGAALAVAGVRAVLTGADLATAGLKPMPCSTVVQTREPLVVPPRHGLAQGRVRHVGEPVAMIVAESLEAARAGLEAVTVAYEERPAVVNAEEALRPGAPLLWAEAPQNRAYVFERGDAAAVEAAFARAVHRVDCVLVNNRIAAAALEPRVAIASHDAAADRFSLLISGASVHAIRRELAIVFGVPESRINVACPDVGGGFGMKNVLYPEFVALLQGARHLGRPIRWVADRLEDFAGGVHARDNLTRARLALDARGRILALHVETVANLGACLSSLGPGSSTNSPATAMGGVYDVPAVFMSVSGVFTNTVPVDAYRGAGKPEANYIIERLIDLAADRLNIDPAALRRRNLIHRFPHRSALGMMIDSGDFRGNFDALLKVSDRAGFTTRRRASRQKGLLRGFGLGCFLETARGQPNEEAWLSFAADGGLDVAIGTQSNGQGHETSFLELVAQRLGLPRTALRLVQGDTARVPRGGGHGGARSLHLGGAALLLAIDDLLVQARPAAREMLQLRAGEPLFRDGAFHAGAEGGSLVRSVTLPEVARRMAAGGQALKGHGDNRCDVFTFPSGAHAAEVEVDPETGQVKLVRYTAVDDYGRLLNPLLTEGQVQGGLAQGIGQALLEEAAYDPASGQLLSATFMDYAMPRGGDLPALDVRFFERPTAANPLGAKGSGQAGTIGAAHTVVAAVLDALRPLGVHAIDMPLTPERVWHAITAARG